VLRLDKALYGLKQAPKMWYEKIDSYLRNQDFKKGTGDYNLYIIRQGEKILLLALYVDDLLFTSNCDKWINWFKQQLESRFEMSELNEGEITLYLKAESVQVPDGIFLTQRGYAWKVLEQFEMTGCSPVSTPMVEKLKLATDMSQPYVDPTYYRSIVRSLIQLEHTRFDIGFAVGIVSRFMARPQVPHLQAARRILRYIKGTWQYGVLYRRNNHPTLTGFIDSDWAGDIEQARSTTGLVFCLGDSPITWLSKRQSSTVLSSTEAEYMAMSNACRESTWLEMLATDLGLTVQQPITLHCDNEASMKMVLNPQITPRNKHIAAHDHYSRDKVGNGDIQLSYVPTTEQLADLFTKPLGKGLFEKFKRQLNLHDFDDVIQPAQKKTKI
jgi:hypothetical protein